VGEDHGKPFTRNTILFWKPIGTVIQAAAGCSPGCQLESVTVDIDAGESDAGVGRGEDVARQAGAAANVAERCPFTGRRDVLYRSATGQVVDMCFRVEAGWVEGSNL